MLWNNSKTIIVHISIGKTIINHPPNHHINRWYEPFPNGWFIIVFYPQWNIYKSRSRSPPHSSPVPKISKMFWQLSRAFLCPVAHMSILSFAAKPPCPTGSYGVWINTWFTLVSHRFPDSNGEFRVYFHTHPYMVGFVWH